MPLAGDALGSSVVSCLESARPLAEMSRLQETIRRTDGCSRSVVRHVDEDHG